MEESSKRDKSVLSSGGEKVRVYGSECWAILWDDDIAGKSICSLG